MLDKIFQELDAWIGVKNHERIGEGLMPLGVCEIRVVGQTALIEAHTKLHLAQTLDVDAYLKAEYLVQKKFEEQLEKIGRVLDSDSHLIWMPAETKYKNIYEGAFVHGFIAEPEYVLLSKALKAPDKNKILLQEYLALGASAEFHALAKKYSVNLEQFVL